MNFADRSQAGPASRPTIELPTLAVAILIHAGWLALTWWHALIPLPLLMLGGGVVIAWHGSLQHETIHGHPTGRRWIDATIGSAPLSLWLPYAVYWRSHRAHHAAGETTDPLEDPESHYVADARGWAPRLARLEATLAGRLLLGPAIRIARFLRDEAVRLPRDPRGWAKDWLPHLASLVPLLWWLDHVGLPLTTYVLAFVYPGASLSLLRSFAEHRADPERHRRAAIVERAPLLALLFLNNNLHAVHHDRPDLAWYRLPAHFRSHRRRFAAAPHYRGYVEVVRRYWRRPQDDVIHPDYRGIEA